MVKTKVVTDIGDADLDNNPHYLKDGTRLTEDLAWQWSDEYEAHALEERRGRPVLGTRVKGDSPRLTARVPEDLNTRVHAFARERGLRISEVVRAALESYVKQ